MVQTCLDMPVTVPGIHEEREQYKVNGAAQGQGS